MTKDKQIVQKIIIDRIETEQPNKEDDHLTFDYAEVKFILTALNNLYDKAELIEKFEAQKEEAAEDDDYGFYRAGLDTAIKITGER